MVHVLGDNEIGDKINLFFAACDVFVLTAIGEPRGLTVLEAMLVERPVMASENGGLVQLIQDCKNGILVDPTSPGEVAKGLIELIGNPSLARWLGRTSSGTAARYSWDRMVMAYDKIYQNALA